MFLLDKTHWEIRQTKAKGKGVFARRKIAPGIVISDYLGIVINPAVDDINEKDGVYLMYYHDYASIYPETLSQPGAHLLNHSCMPTCWITTRYGHTLFFALRTIYPGEELTISYLLAPQETCGNCNHACFCESTQCSGTMHLSHAKFTAWQAFAQKEAMKTKRKRVAYHKRLKPLPEYPHSLPDHPIYDLFGNEKEAPETIIIKKIPTASELRKIIRKTGRQLYFPVQKKHVVGVQNNTIIFGTLIPIGQ